MQEEGESSSPAVDVNAAAAAAAIIPSSPFFGTVGQLEAWSSLPYAASLYYPYDGQIAGYPFPHGYGMDLNGARRKNATRETTSMLKAWLSEHRKNPYPTKGEKIMLAIVTKMTLTQVSTWFANARRRLKKENKMTWSPRNRCEEDEAADAEAEKSDKALRDSGSASPTGSSSHHNDRRSPHSPHRRIRDDDDSDIVDIEEDSDNEDSGHQLSSHRHSSKRLKLTSGSSGSPSSPSSLMPSPFGPLHPAAIGAGLQFPDGSRLPPGFPAFPSAHHPHSHPHHPHHLPPPPPLPPSSPNHRMHQQAAAIAAHQMAAAAAAFNHTSFHPNTYSHLIQAQQQHQQQQLMMHQDAIKSEANHNDHHHHRHHHPHQTPLPHHTISTTSSGKPRIWSIADMATGGSVVAAGGEKPVVTAKPTAAAES